MTAVDGLTLELEHSPKSQAQWVVGSCHPNSAEGTTGSLGSAGQAAWVNQETQAP